MTPRVRVTSLATALLALVASCTEPAGAPVRATAASALIVPDDVELWTTRENRIPVCFVNGTDLEQAGFRATVERTWGRAAAISIQWSSSCPFTEGTEQVRVSISPTGRRRSSGTATIGTAAASAPADQVWCMNERGQFVLCRGVDLRLGTDRSDAEYVSIHLFGHVLGFGNDEMMYDLTGCRPQSGTGYGAGDYPFTVDRASVMFGCGDRRPFLSEVDRWSAAWFYGRWPDRRDRLADLDGDGNAEPIATNLDSSWALRSGGFGFYGFHWLSGPFYGSLATLYGDVTGDGLDDGVAINADGAYVAASNGTTLGFPALWAALPLSDLDATGRYHLADMNGDGRADLVQVTPSALVAVGFSTGTSFALDGRPGHHGQGWWYGISDLQHDLADVDGDGRAELIQWRGSSIALTRFGDHNESDTTIHDIAPQLWVDREVGFGDVDGDGRADLIAVSYAGVDVIRSFDAPVLVPERWTEDPFWGTHATLFGDVNGDGLADLVAVNDDNDLVAVSTGAKFLPFGVPWTGWPFYSLP